MHELGFILTAKGVLLFFDGKSVPVDKTHLYFEDIVTELKKGHGNFDVARVKELSNIPETIKGKLFGDVTVTDGQIYYKNRPLHNTLTTKMIEVMREGWDIAIWANFLNNVMKNPSQTAIDELYLFLEAAQMPLTSDGHFLAFKKVNNDYTSIYDNKTDNSIGSKPSMPRETVDPNRNSTCSRGLHFCAHSYLTHFGDASKSRVVVVKINPADVVAIPSDYANAKGRAWTYEVVSEIDNPGDGEREKRFDVAVDDSWDAPEEDTAELALGDTPSDLLFGDIYTAQEILDKVNEIGSIRGAGRALRIAKSTFGDWVKKAKEITSQED
jgi:hypothetical protein